MDENVIGIFFKLITMVGKSINIEVLVARSNVLHLYKTNVTKIKAKGSFLENMWEFSLRKCDSIFEEIS